MHAQSLLGDIVHVELPEVGKVFAAKEDTAMVESVKATANIYTPLDGTIVEVNSKLTESPELLNQEPYEGGWIFKVEIKDPSQVDAMLSQSAYDKVVEEES